MLFNRMMMAAAPGNKATDPYWGNVVLLVQADSFPFVDATGKTITNNGSVAFSAVDPPFGAGSAEFNRTNWLSASHADLALGTADCTVEFFANTSDYNFNQHWIDFRTGGTGLVIYNLGRKFQIYANGGTVVGGVTDIFENDWNHIAACRQSGVWSLFVGGNLEGQSTTTSFNFTQTSVKIGIREDNAEGVLGKMCGVRVTKGIARYTTNFTPPSQIFPTF